MKVLKWVLLLGGIVIFCFGIHFFFQAQKTPVSQLFGMMGLALVGVVAGLAIKNKP
jgi:hypothetical protein